MGATLTESTRLTDPCLNNIPTHRPPSPPKQIKDFDAKPYFNDKKASVRNDRVTLLGVAASKIALEDAKLDLGAIDGGAWVHC